LVVIHLPHANTHSFPECSAVTTTFSSCHWSPDCSSCTHSAVRVPRSESRPTVKLLVWPREKSLFVCSSVGLHASAAASP
jgi:hypothetical protein